LGQPDAPLDPHASTTPLFGRALEAGFRETMERSFRHDFSGVRVHDDAEAHETAKAHSASAFTRGADIFVAERSDETAGEDGRRRMAHELAHVVQQSPTSGGPAGPSRVTAPDDPTEVDADKAALAVVQGRPPDVQHRLTGAPVTQRQQAAPGAPGTGVIPATMAINTVWGPAEVSCGNPVWQVTFNLPTASPRGGYFVQEVSANRTTTDCRGGGLPAGNLSFHYWEAWRVSPNATTDDFGPSVGFSDQYGFGNPPPGSKGVFSVYGTVSYYDGLTLPASFVRGAPGTAAGNLPATTSDPHLGWNTSTRPHNMTGNWSCCPNDQSSTISHNP
jgi:hypothetical protein